MHLRIQVLLWSGALALGLAQEALKGVDADLARRMLHATAALMAASVVAYFAWPAPAEASSPASLREMLREKAICPRCLQANPVRRVRCRRCIAPIGWQATMVAFEVEVTEGWVAGAVASEPRPTLLQWVGALMLCGPAVLQLLTIAVSSPLDLGVFAFMFVFSALYGWLLALTTLHFFRPEQRPSEPPEAPDTASPGGGATRD